MAEDCGAGALANELKTDLLAGEDLAIPDIDVSGPEYNIPVPGEDDPIFSQIARLKIADLTEKKVGGDGAFDALMTALSLHLKQEYEGNRITGQEYSKTYIAMMEGALAQGANFLLGKDASYWNAVAAQVQAKMAVVQEVTARVLLAKSKVELAMVKIAARNAEADYALTKLKLATESAAYCTAQYQLDTLLPQQNLMLIEQTRGAKEAADMSSAQRTLLLPKQISQLDAQIDQTLKGTLMVVAQTTGQTLQNTQLFPKQVLQLEAAIAMTNEQREAQRAQTVDTRTDGTPILGLLGKQKDLYTQQITSYKRDAEIKAARPFIDAWITMKTIDEGVNPPTAFANASLDQILETLKTNNDL